ncbi:MAG: hypothetical protein J5988_05175, partial [Eubacterium sp.]|nr:hypothetical protein [Eubacterium sp.]
MMEVEYKREMNRNYMVVEPNLGHNEKYAVRMLSGNKIPGLLPFHDKYVNGEMRYYYDITSKQPLDRILEHRTMSGQEIRTFIGDLVLVLKQMERFLLDEGQLCFDEKMIYIEPESFRVSFCLIPGKYGVFATEFCELAQYLLDHVSHNDGDAVVLAFSVFKESRKMNFGIEDIERCLQSKEPEKEIAIRPAKELEKDLEEDLPIEFNSFESLAKEGQEVGITLTKGRKIVSGIILSVMIAIPVIIFLAVGINGIMRWKWILMAVEILLTVTMIIIINTAGFTAASIEPEAGKHIYKDADNE